MQLTRYTDYGLRILIFLTALNNRRSASIDEVCEVFGLSKNHVTKIVHRLGLDGFITTQRGKGGGIRLASAPHQIIIGDVVRKLETTLQPVDCEQPKACIMLPHCALRGVLADAMEAFMQELDCYTLEDLVNRRDVIKLVGS